MANAHVILFSHGSRENLWRETFEKLVAAVSARLSSKSVSCAFLDHATPPLAEAIAVAAAGGARVIYVLPLFFSMGGHVLRDVPRVIAACQEQFPELVIEILPAVGEDARFAGWLAEILAGTI